MMAKATAAQEGRPIGQTDFTKVLIFEVDSPSPVADLYPQVEANKAADVGGFTRASTPKLLSTEQRKLADGNWHQIHIFQVEVAK